METIAGILVLFLWYGLPFIPIILWGIKINKDYERAMNTSVEGTPLKIKTNVSKDFIINQTVKRITDPYDDWTILSTYNYASNSPIFYSVPTTIKMDTLTILATFQTVEELDRWILEQIFQICAEYDKDYSHEEMIEIFIEVKNLLWEYWGFE